MSGWWKVISDVANRSRGQGRGAASRASARRQLGCVAAEPAVKVSRGDGAAGWAILHGIAARTDLLVQHPVFS
jgi:hypothetical protein